MFLLYPLHGQIRPIKCGPCAPINKVHIRAVSCSAISPKERLEGRQWFRLWRWSFCDPIFGNRILDGLRKVYIIGCVSYALSWWCYLFTFGHQKVDVLDPAHGPQNIGPYPCKGYIYILLLIIRGHIYFKSVAYIPLGIY